jgi:hypothetical protein
MSVFSSILNSLYLYLYGDGSTSSVENPNPCLTISASYCGTLKRMFSTSTNKSYHKLTDGGFDYVYGTDSCQTAYLVEYVNSTYKVTILFTRDNRPDWIKATLDVIMIRILLAVGNLPVLSNPGNQCPDWAIIGSIDCQPDRDKANTGFHQDNILTNFIPDNVNGINLRQRFEFFFRQTFPSNPPDVERFDPVICPFGNGFPVYSPLTAHFGILDYNSPIPIIAATSRSENSYTFTILPASTDARRSFLFYLNSIITHSTPNPELIDVDNIEAWYNQNPHQTDYGGQATLQSLLIILREYNLLFDEMSIYPRNFRRLLAKVIITDRDKIDRILALKTVFSTSATHLYDFTSDPPEYWEKAPPPPPPPDDDDDDDDADPPPDADPINTNIYAYAQKVYTSSEIEALKTGIAITNNETTKIVPISDNLHKAPRGNQITIGRTVVENKANKANKAIDTKLGGKSRSKTRQKRNTKKRYNRKGRITNKKKHNRRRTKKR